MKKPSLLLGAHMSIAGGLEKAIERGESIGCTAIQIFSKSNRQWAAKEITKQEAEHFKSVWKSSSIKYVVAHATYLINIGSPEKLTCSKSVKALSLELMRCEQLNIPYLVLHPGSHLKTSEQECLKRIADNLNEIFESTRGKTKILLETMPGQGSMVCYSFEQIATLLDLSSFKQRLGVCFDTCHAFVAGYDFRTKETYDMMWKTFNSIIGLDYLKVIHINDSKKDLGSYVDRHENIGKGKLGLDAFRLLCNDKRFFDIPKILETPKTTLADDAKNMAALKSLLSTATRAIFKI